MPERRRSFKIIGNIENTVKKNGTGAHVTLPKAWIGRRVIIQLVEEDEV